MVTLFENALPSWQFTHSGSMVALRIRPDPIVPIRPSGRQYDRSLQKRQQVSRVGALDHHGAAPGRDET